jgi:hypothetical protein
MKKYLAFLFFLALLITGVAQAGTPSYTITNVTQNSYTVTITDADTGVAGVQNPCGLTFRNKLARLKSGTSFTTDVAQNVAMQACISPPPPPPPPPPATFSFVAPASGATVSGTVTVEVSGSPTNTAFVDFYCYGNTIGEDTVQNSNGDWSVQWDTVNNSCADSSGLAGLRAFAFNSAGSQLAAASEDVHVSNSTSPPPPPPPPPAGSCPDSTVPAPATGLTAVFTDCFNTLDRTTWCSHQWYEPTPPLDSQSVDANGILHLTKRDFEGWQDTTMSTEPCGQANPHSYQYGYFEARMKYDAVKGNGPAFWLFSTRHATNPNWPSVNSYCSTHGLPVAQCYSAELDVFEGYGGNPDVFTGTLHRNSCGCYGVADTQTSNNWQPMGFDMSQWHTVAARWTATQITWYVDGVAVMSDPPYDSTPQPMHVLLYNWDTPWQGSNTPNSAAVEDVQVDWVRVWQ